MGTVRIPLSGGNFALIDEEDYDLIAQYRWCEFRVGGHVYAITNRGTLLMHRLILNPGNGVDVDHRNRDGLDNRRENLRPATKAQNQRNRPKASWNRSGYKGVFWNKGRQRWSASIRAGGVPIRIGSFEDPIEAAKAYDAKARELHGEFAYTNFPEDGAA